MAKKSEKAEVKLSETPDLEKKVRVVFYENVFNSTGAFYADVPYEIPEGMYRYLKKYNVLREAEGGTEK